MVKKKKKKEEGSRRRDCPSDPERAREFNETATKILEDAGFNASYHKSDSVTLSFTKTLPNTIGG